MAHKVFVSYKYWDDDVAPIYGTFVGKTKVRDYVDWLENRFRENNEQIYKGEYDGEDLSDKTDEYIWRKLKDKIYDSSVTIVLISPNMREIGKWDKSQWIPWEISYSIREMPRNGCVSHSNAILAVVLPDKQGSYTYYDKLTLFKILKENIDIKYIPVVKWEDFRYDREYYIEKAIKAKDTVPAYMLTKLL